MRKYNNLYERLVAHVTVPEDQCESTGCWAHDGSLSKPIGYPQITVREDGKHKRKLVHRVMFEHFNGTIPPDKEVDHVCHNRRCCNPDHLQLLSIPDNRAKNQWRKR